MTLHAGRCLVLLDPDLLPEAWSDRISPLAVVPLMPQEVARLLDHAGGEAGSEDRFSTDDRRLAEALVAGKAVPVIARAMCVTPRSVQRRIARLRNQLSVSSTEELVATLVRMGF